jgi:bacterial/archaeal transporter family protein
MVSRSRVITRFALVLAAAVATATNVAALDSRWLKQANHHDTPYNNNYYDDHDNTSPTQEQRTHRYSSTFVNDNSPNQQQKQPKLGQWILPALTCALSYALYNIFIKKGSYSINPVLGGVILQFVAALLGSLLLFYIIMVQTHENHVNSSSSSTPTKVVLQWDWHGVQWAICAGISVGLAEMISFLVSGMGVPSVQTIPIIIGGSVMFGTLLGMLLLGESLQWNGWLGVLMLIGGICLVGIDPGARHGHS